MATRLCLQTSLQAETDCHSTYVGIYFFCINATINQNTRTFVLVLQTQFNRHRARTSGSGSIKQVRAYNVRGVGSAVDPVRGCPLALAVPSTDPPQSESRSDR
jgi:hypothetical protein